MWCHGIWIPIAPQRTIQIICDDEQYVFAFQGMAVFGGRASNTKKQHRKPHEISFAAEVHHIVEILKAVAR